MPQETPPLGWQSRDSGDSQFIFVKEATQRHWALMFVCMAFGALVWFGIDRFLLELDSQGYAAQADLAVKQSLWQSPVLEELGQDVFGRTTPESLAERLDMDLYFEDVARLRVQQDIETGRSNGRITSDEELDALAASIAGRIQIEPLEEQGILRLRAHSFASQEDAIALAEAGVRVLIEHTQIERRDEQHRAHSIVQAQLEEIRGKVERAESRQWEFRESMGFQTHDQMLDDMERKNAELIAAQIDKEEVLAKLEQIDARLVENTEGMPDALGNVTDSVVQGMLRELDDLRQRQIELSIVWKAGYPPLDELQDEIAEKKRAILQAINELNDAGGGSGLWEERQELYRRKVDLNLQATALDIRIATLRKTLADMVAERERLAERSFEYQQLAQEASHYRDQFNRTLEKEFEIKSALERESATVERRSAAIVLPVQGRSMASMLGSVGLGGLVGLLVGFALAVMLEMNDTSIKNAEDVGRYLNLEVIGMIPLMRFGRSRTRRKKGDVHAVNAEETEPDSTVVTQHDPKSPVSEAYRTLRTTFQFATIQQDPKTVMVTSAVPAEGKTTTAVNFAVTMADRGMRVLIVDTDLRRPNVHRVMRMDRGSGLADVLREQIPVNDVIRPTRTENLWILSAGGVPPNPSELIGSERMKNLMADLGETFDLIVCDAPSVLVVTDPVLLASHVDSVVLVLSAGFARRETVLRAKKLLETADAKFAGVVLNALKATGRHYYYYYYYYDEAGQPGRHRWRRWWPTAFAR